MHGPGEPLHGWHSRPLGAAHLLALLHASCHSPAESQGPPRHPSATLAPTDHLACILLSCLNLMPMGGKCRDPSSAQRGWGITKKAHLAASFFRGAEWVELLRFLTRNVHEPRHTKFVSEHAKRITPWGFLQWHCDVAVGRKLLKIAF